MQKSHLTIPLNNMFSKQQIQDKIDNLNKPKGSLGRLESLALQICTIQDSLEPKLTHPCHLLFGADYGIEQEGVSLSPRCITWQQMINFTRGGGGVNMFCRQHGFDLHIIDMGVDHDLSGYPQIINRKIRENGTGNFLYEPSMRTDEFQRCIDIGGEMVDKCHEEGCNVISIGEMGIGNTSPSSILMHLFLNIPLEKCVGAGAGLDKAGIEHKLEVLQRAVDNYISFAPAMKALTGIQGVAEEAPTMEAAVSASRYASRHAMQYFCGFEMAAAVGAMLRAADHHMIILVDGFIMTACMLGAMRLRPSVKDYAVFCHCGDEAGHRLMLDAMGADPLLSLGMRLGEGTGAICAYPILQSAVNMVNEMNNFDNAQITKYF